MHTRHLVHALPEPRRNEHLPACRLRAQPSCRVQGSAPEAALHRHGLAHVNADADQERQLRPGGGLLRADGYQLRRRADRLSGRGEHCERLVTAQLDHVPAARFHRVSREVGERLGEPCRLCIATLPREPRVAADVGDQERPDLRPGGRSWSPRSHGPRLFCHYRTASFSMTGTMSRPRRKSTGRCTETQTFANWICSGHAQTDAGGMSSTPGQDTTHRGRSVGACDSVCKAASRDGAWRA